MTKEELRLKYLSKYNFENELSYYFSPGRINVIGMRNLTSFS